MHLGQLANCFNDFNDDIIDRSSSLEKQSCACKLDRAIHLDLIIIVHCLGLLQCSPVVNAAWIGSVLGALVRLAGNWAGLGTLCCCCSKTVTVAMQSFWTCKTA